MLKIILASHNPHKLREFRNIFRSLPYIDLVSLHSYPQYILPEETGKTFEENALIKAQYIAKATNSWVIADDSGLIVPALNEQPGVHSARYAGDKATDRENRIKLLQEMAHLQDDEQRFAYFECCIVLAHPEKSPKIVHGRCTGAITFAEKGGQGFGYDPIFIKDGYNQTFAELEEGIKNRISHRRKAIDALLPTLETLARNEILY